MKVLAINSSARKDGNTAYLIGTVFEELNKEGIETEMIQLAGSIIEPCKACWACGGKKNCVHKKDRFQEIYEKTVKADGIILGSPVYTANISANMQAFLERAMEGNTLTLRETDMVLRGLTIDRKHWQINGKTAVFTEEFRSRSWVQNMNQYSHI